MKENLEKYADLLLVRCLQLKEKQRPLLISAPVEVIELVRILAHKAYALGVKDIYFDFEDEILKHEQFMYLDEEDILKSSFWDKSIFDEYAAKGAAFLLLYSEDVDIMKDVDAEKMSKAKQKFRTSRPLYKKLQSTDDIPWCIGMVATEGYARKLFPNNDNALSLAWDAIFKCCLVYEDDPVEAWNEKINKSMKRSSILNEKRFRFLHYTNSLGTDLRIELPKQHIWSSAGGETPSGNIIVNMPTEEVFTSPNRNGVDGIVYSARPLVYGGALISDFSLRFEGGRIVEVHAKEGEEILKKMIETEDASHYLGEVALVDNDSPISNMNLVFYETLYDENASCHLAIGDGFPNCFSNGENMDRDELMKEGLNHSTVHTDFMVGTSDLNIVGTTWDGEEIQVFKDGNFVIEG